MRLVVAATVLVVLLAGCSAFPATKPTATAVPASSIESMSTAHRWVDGLKTTEPNLASKMSAGIAKVGDIVEGQSIWFETRNKIGQDLLKINSAVLASPANAGSQIDNLKDELAVIDTAIAHGDRP